MSKLPVFVLVLYSCATAIAADLTSTPSATPTLSGQIMTPTVTGTAGLASASAPATSQPTTPARGLNPNATVEEVHRTAQGLLQMGKPEETFAICIQAVKAKPQFATGLREVAAQAYAQMTESMRSGLQTKKTGKSWAFVPKLWGNIIDPSAPLLFASPAEYQQKLQDAYALVLQSTYEMAMMQKNKKDYAKALKYATMAVELNTKNPDPRALKLKAELQALAAASGQNAAVAANSGVVRASISPLPVTAGVEFTITSPNGDGYNIGESGFRPDLCIGNALSTALLSFPNVAIPKGARIKHATLRGYRTSYANNNDGIFQVAIFGEDADNPQTALATAPMPKDRVRTKQRVQWTIQAPVEGWVESPDISLIVNALVRRPNYQPGETMNFILSGGRGMSNFISYDQDPQRAFRLVVEY